MRERKNWFRDKSYDSQLQLEQENKRICKHCGYSTQIPIHKKSILCKNCGHWVFRDAKEEAEYRKDEQKQAFKRRMKEQLNRK